MGEEVHTEAARERITKMVDDAFASPDPNPLMVKPLIVELVLSGTLMVQAMGRMQGIIEQIGADLKEAQRQQKALIK